MAIKNIFTSEKFVIRKFLKNNKTYLSFLHTKYSINESQRIFNSKNIVRNDIIEDYDESKASKYTKPSLLIKYFWK